MKLAKLTLWVASLIAFFVVLSVLLLRLFWMVPYRIPSGAMIPTLQVGDYILVNEVTFGLRLPFTGKKIVDVNSPQRGDVVVFRYPENPSVFFIKRVVGVPGDVIEYRDKQLTVNGALQPQLREGDYNYTDSGLHFVRYSENLNGHAHDILIKPDTPLLVLGAVTDYPHHENCSYSEKLVRCTVPPGNYFMMGDNRDNRDNSRDSRYWGFVPDNLVIGKAYMIGMNFGDTKRIGSEVK